MIKCNGCRKEKDLKFFIKGKKTLKKCKECRDTAKEWKDNNKDRVSKYNEMYRNNKNNEINKTLKVLLAKKINETEWKEYKTLKEAAELLKLQTSNISKVLNGKLKHTGNYLFKREEKQIEKKEVKSWEEIKKENNYGHAQIGQPSLHRVLHETINNIIGKKCCSCQIWKPLTKYNYSNNHWDDLRNDCKDCLSKWRKDNRDILNQNHKEYEKERKLIDPEFKLIKTLRSRLGTALKTKNAKKNMRTLDLTGCTISFLMEFLEKKFIEGMTWENHGDWHIDHIKPISLFNLLNEEEQKKCFHYTNLQPLWAADNLSKSNKYNENS